MCFWDSERTCHCPWLRKHVWRRGRSCWSSIRSDGIRWWLNGVRRRWTTCLLVNSASKTANSSCRTWESRTRRTTTRSRSSWRPMCRYLLSLRGVLTRIQMEQPSTSCPQLERHQSRFQAVAKNIYIHMVLVQGAYWRGRCLWMMYYINRHWHWHWCW